MIPRTLHVIWIGDNPIPTWVLKNWSLWKKFLNEASSLEWNVKAWTNDTIIELPEFAKWWELRHELEDARVLPDILRLMIIRELGGVYVDSDTVPLRSFDHVMETSRAWINGMPKDADPGALTLNNAFFGAEAGHPFFRAMITEATRAFDRGIRNPHYLAGPRTFRKVADRFPDIVRRYECSMSYQRAHVHAMRMGITAADEQILAEDLHGPIAHIGVSYGSWTEEELANA